MEIVSRLGQRSWIIHYQGSLDKRMSYLPEFAEGGHLLLGLFLSLVVVVAVVGVVENGGVPSHAGT